MRKLITTIALLALIDTSAAIGQTVGSRNPSAPPPSTNMDPNDPINRENAQLDRMTKGICRGC
jgi:hypothetical protein